MIDQRRVPLKQRRDLGAIVEAAISLYMQNFVPLATIAAVIVPLGIATAAFQSSVDNETTMLVIIIVLGLVQTFVNFLAAGAIIAALADIDAGRGAEFYRAYDVAFDRVWTLIGAALRVIFHVLLFFITIVGIPWGIQRGVRWIFVQQAVILDGTSARAALSYSADAVEGSWWRTLGIMLLVGLMAGVPSGIIGALFTLAPILVSGTVNALVNALVLPFGIIAATLLYMDLKVRKESNVPIGPA